MGKSFSRSKLPASTRRRRLRATRKEHFQIFPYRQRAALLSPGELAFFRALRLAVAPWHWISLKMRLADVVQCPSYLWEKTPGRRLSQKHVDFVLYDCDTTRIV